MAGKWQIAYISSPFYSEVIASDYTLRLYYRKQYMSRVSDKILRQEVGKLTFPTFDKHMQAKDLSKLSTFDIKCQYI